MEMVRRIKSEDRADKWLFFKEGNDYGVDWACGVDFGPLFSKQVIKKWEANGEVIGHRVRGNCEEWFIL